MRVAGAPGNLREGDVLAGKYVVERVIGAGGMGQVLAAQHLLLGSPVAIKVLLPSAAELPGARERFVREARAAATLRSEHVARVMDVGVHDDGTPYLVMEYLTGTDLRRALRARGPMPVADVAEYISQICEAMAEAHGLGIFHRDLKPANLFLTQRPNGTPLVKVLDFGLAKVLEDAPKAAGDASLTATGLVVGSPPYMPPEQLRSLKLADARSDIWSLGVVLFELLAGRQPFQADRPAGLIVAIATDEPPPPRSLRPELPEAIEVLILRCLQKDPRARPQSVREIAAALAPFVAPRAPMASAGAFGVGASGPPRATGAPEATLPMTRVSSVPATFAVGAPPPEQRGGQTTLTSGSAELPTRRAPSRPSRALVWGLGAAGLMACAIVVGLVLGLAPVSSESAPDVASPSETRELPGSPVPLPADEAAEAPSVPSAPSGAAVAGPAAPSGLASSNPAIAVSAAPSGLASSSPATSSAAAAPGATGKAAGATGGAVAPAVASTRWIPPKGSPASTSAGKAPADPLKAWK